MLASFENLGLNSELLQTLAELDHIEPTPIQARAIPQLLSGKDVMGQAQTGTGKTAAFTLPMLQRMAPHGLQALILTPTRELAIQTADAVYRYGHRLGVRVLPIYGGQPYSRQLRRLKKDIQIIVGTPGRTLDLIRQGALDLAQVRFVVLDEADEMLKMGFIDDVEAILSATDTQARQTTLFSATLPDAIQRMARQYMHDPLLVAIESREVTVENITQRYYLVHEGEKVAALSRLLEVEELRNTLIFTRTKAGAARLAETLIARSYPAEAIHGDLPQMERERILHRFRGGQLTILVGTDVVARGVDIPDVSHVINYDIPQLPIEYVHRIGRTGRAGRDGDAITLVTPQQFSQIRTIEQFTKKAMTRATLPSREAVLRHRDVQFKAGLIDELNRFDAQSQLSLVNELEAMGYPPELLASLAVKLLRAHEAQRPLEEVHEAEIRRKNRDRVRPPQPNRDPRKHEAGMVRLHMNIGRSTGIRPADIVYGIASQANIPGRSIGAITIQQNETFLDVAENHVQAVLAAMQRGKIRGRAMTLALADARAAARI